MQRPLTHFGHGEDTFAVTYVRDESGSTALMSPVPTLAVPLAVVWIKCSTQVLSAGFAGFGIGSGGAKKQFASSAQLLAIPPQLASLVHANPLVTQRFPGPAPRVQLSGELPAFPL